MKFIKYFFTELGSGLRDFWVGFPKFVKRNWKTIRKYLIFWLIVIAVFVGLYFVVPHKYYVMYLLGLGVFFFSFLLYITAMHAPLEDGMMYSWNKEELKIILLIDAFIFVLVALFCIIFATHFSIKFR